MENHVPIRRLLAVAAADDEIFTLEEFNHLKECAKCFATWSEFIHQVISNNGSLSEEKTEATK